MKTNSEHGYWIFAIIIAIAILMSSLFITKSYIVNDSIDVIDTDYFFEIAKGNIQNHSSIFKFGANPAVGVVEEVIWDGSGPYTFLTTCDNLAIRSNDINDNGITKDTGAWNVIVSGLDSDYNPISEFITLNGTTNMYTTQCFLRTFRAQIINSGLPNPTQDANEGTITIETKTAGTDQALILPNVGQTLMTVYTCPANTNCYVTGINLAVGEGKQATIRAKMRQCTNTTICSFSTKYATDLFESPFFGPLEVFFKVPEKTDIAFTALSTSAAGTSVTASFGLILVQDD